MGTIEEALDFAILEIKTAAPVAAATGLRLAGGVAGAFFALTQGSAGGNSEVIFEAANRERFEQQHQRGSTTENTNEGDKKGLEPGAAAGGSGERSGGGRTGRKINEDRAASATDALTSLRNDLKQLQSTPNKTPEIKEQIKKVQGQINRQLDRLKKSEEHARQVQ